MNLDSEATILTSGPRVQDRPSRTPFFLLLCAFTVMPACADDALDTDGYDVGDPGLPAITPGVYEARLEIVEDGCTPSLESVRDDYELWPPPRMAVRVVPRISTREWWLEMWYSDLRTGLNPVFPSRLSPDGRPLVPVLIDESWPFEQNAQVARCDYPYASADFESRFKVVTNRDGELSIHVETVWREIFDCAEDGVRNDMPWIPDAACTEAYKYSLKLEDACEPIPECELEVWTGGSGGAFFNARQMQCECRDPSSN